MQRGNVGGKSPACYLVGVANNAMWAAYGFMTSQPPIYRVNFVGAVLQSLYLACFVAYSSGPARKSTVRQASFEGVALVGVLWWLHKLSIGTRTG